MPTPDLQVTSRIHVPGGELSFSFSRSSGPGGQNVNKVESKATLRWNAAASPSLPPDVRERFLTAYAPRMTKDGHLLVTSQKTRDQGKNIADCLEKLRGMLRAVAQPPRRRRKSKPSRSSQLRRLSTKKSHAAKKASRRGEW